MNKNKKIFIGVKVNNSNRIGEELLTFFQQKSLSELPERWIISSRVLPSVNGQWHFNNRQQSGHIFTALDLGF